MAERHEFSERSKRTLGERAAYICSNPTCRAPTIGPHTDPDKSIKTGEACHIAAAAVGGPRYDKEQTEEQRRDITNGLWLCTECSTRIDRDPARFPIELLRNWKSTHETWLCDGGIVPRLPEVKVVTQNGLPLPETPGSVTAAQVAAMRNHLITISNTSDTTIENLQLKLNFPEPVEGAHSLDVPAGVTVDLKPRRPQMNATMTGGGSVTRLAPPRSIPHVDLRISHLPARSHVSFHLVTVRPDESLPDFSSGIWASMNRPGILKDYFDGTYAFTYHGATITKRLFVPLSFDPESRAIASGPASHDQGDAQLVEGFIFT